MTEEINLPKNANKEEIYKALLPQVKALLSGEEDLVANMANMSAVLKEAFGFFWVGFYIIKKGELVLGPFQGPVACTRIQKGKGVCGKAWETGETQLVPDVNAFPGHIACSASSQSEIVVPVSKGKKIIAVLDIDSDQLNAFEAVDRKYLEEMVGYL
ncbi:GAF domain-containing protein [Cyclobacterium qasimii]|uniref:GAF domain-containing protein involved in signal transduction n=2 Tax=Cyclobacterium qasimii TaxID=1350429 RepID=S7WQI7_9BACT|nr:GAF domain-containing protein [Cyclobacterium qasimii]EPR69014.1 GAF domain-containing protein involved in signal transduction [Cyclobacterium qasimii M12-11B]GEO23488.1 diguanylate cyclase [Cyclobacterium qasimii]